MEYKNLGRTGLKVSALSFGTMTFGGESDEQTSAEVYKKCRDAGINLFDCANIYCNGRSEEILGKLIRHERKDIILTSKVYYPTHNEINARGLSRKHIYQALHDSLERLKTDYLDIYFMHHFDEQTPLEETLETMRDLVTQGKVRYIGASNFASWQIMKAIGLADLNKLPFIQVIQPMYNLVKRQAEVEILPMAQSENIAVVSYNPLAGGLLTGKYANATESGTRFYDRKLYQLRYQTASAIESTRKFVDLAKSHGYSPVSLAIAWVAAHPAITSPLLGARNISQLSECLDSVKIPMTEDLRKQISLCSAEPPLATDRSEELVAKNMSVLS